MSAQQSTSSQGEDAEASAQQLLADEERAKVKAAAKKAKKQKQKAKKSQPGSSGTAAAGVSPSTADPSATDSVAPVSPGTSAQLAASADAFNSSAAADGVESTATHLKQLSLTARTRTEEDTFLEQLFCCPLTKVSGCA